MEKIEQYDGQIDLSYKKAREWLTDYISRRNLKPGDKMPSERALAESLGLSRPTIAKAISELAAMGVLERAGRSGTYVRGIVTARKEASRLSIAMVMPYIKPANGDGHPHRDYADYFPREDISGDIMQGVISVVKHTGCRFVVYHNNSALEQAEIIDLMLNERLDGAVVWPEPFADQIGLYQRILSQGPPVVFVDRYIPQVDVDCVVTDNFAGSRDAVRRLIAKGHRRIAFFTEFSKITSVVDREAGYRAALEEAGLPCDEDIICGPQIVRDGLWSFEHALEHCIKPGNPVTAVFGIKDDVVYATIEAGRRLSLTMPYDLEVAGFFDAPMPTSIDMPFIRVVQDTPKIGLVAGQLLLDRIAGTAPKDPRHVLVPPKILPE